MKEPHTWNEVPTKPLKAQQWRAIHKIRFSVYCRKARCISRFTTQSPYTSSQKQGGKKLQYCCYSKVKEKDKAANKQSLPFCRARLNGSTSPAGNTLMKLCLLSTQHNAHNRKYVFIHVILSNTEQKPREKSLLYKISVLFYSK